MQNCEDQGLSQVKAEKLTPISVEELKELQSDLLSKFSQERKKDETAVLSILK